MILKTNNFWKIIRFQLFLGSKIDVFVEILKELDSFVSDFGFFPPDETREEENKRILKVLFEIKSLDGVLFLFAMF